MSQVQISQDVARAATALITQEVLKDLPEPLRLALSARILQVVAAAAEAAIVYYREESLAPGDN